MTDKEFYIWFAGFWEGEGACFYPRTKKRYLRNYVLALVQTVKDERTSEECFNLIKDKFGGYLHYYKPSNLKHSLQYRWYLYKEDKIKEILYIILPYLLIRKKEVIEILNYLENKEQRNFTPTPQEIEMILNSTNDSALGRKLGWSHKTIVRAREKIL